MDGVRYHPDTIMMPNYPAILILCMLALVAMCVPQAHASESREQLDNRVGVVLQCMANEYFGAVTDAAYEAAYVACGGDITDGYVYDVYEEELLLRARERDNE